MAVELIDAVQAAHSSFNTCSFDRGFYSEKNRKALDARLAVNALPKKGKLTVADRARQDARHGSSIRRLSRVWLILDFGVENWCARRARSTLH